MKVQEVDLVLKDLLLEGQMMQGPRLAKFHEKLLVMWQI